MEFMKDLEHPFSYKTDFRDGKFQKVVVSRGSPRTRQNRSDFELKSLHDQPLPTADLKL